MSSRMEKYYQENKGRSQRNENLYKDIKSSEIDDYELSSNVSILGNSPQEINVEEIREMLEYKYRGEPKRRSIELLPEEESVVPEREETKEYDINTILAKAKGEKEVDYEVDRLRKVRNTQYDILKNLNLEGSEEESKEKEVSTEEEKLLNLIHTITEKELKEPEALAPLDVLSDLKGNDDTQIIEPAKLAHTVDAQTLKDAIKEEVKTQIDKSFFTGGAAFDKKDFEDFKGLKEDVKSSKIIIKVLILVILLTLGLGVFLLLRTILV